MFGYHDVRGDEGAGTFPQFAYCRSDGRHSRLFLPSKAHRRFRDILEGSPHFSRSGCIEGVFLARNLRGEPRGRRRLTSRVNVDVAAPGEAGQRVIVVG